MAKRCGIRSVLQWGPTAGLLLLSMGTGSAGAQTGHPSGVRGGLLVPSALTLPRNAVALGSHATFTRVGTLNTVLGLGSITWAPSHFIQLHLSRSSFFSGSGDSYFDYDGYAPGHAFGPIGLTYRLPRAPELPLQISLSGSVTPGVHQRSLSGHNHPYGRDTFDISLSLAQTYTRESVQWRLFQGFVITEETPTSIPSHALLGAGITWWWQPWGGVELELLSRLEATSPVNILKDYLGASAGLVVRPSSWLNLRGGYLLGLSGDRTDGIGLRAEQWMAYGGFEVILWGRQSLPRPPGRPLGPPAAEPVQPETARRDTIALAPPPQPTPVDTPVVAPTDTLEVMTPAPPVVPAAWLTLPDELNSLEEAFLRTGVLTLHELRFAYNSTRLQPESYGALYNAGLILRKHADLKIEIGGHADGIGSQAYNRELSQGRAQSVLNWLLEHVEGLTLERFTVYGYGITRPIASNDTEQGRRLNRRVEFTVLNRSVLEEIRAIPPGR
jgi:outer membrane protein OmpA-like peptidoglycan-associated protein